MKANEFTLLAQQLGLTPFGQVFCGEVGRWPITLNNNKLAYIRVFTEQPRSREAMQKISAGLKTWGGRIYSWSGNDLWLSAAKKNRMQGSEAEYVEYCAQILSDAGLLPRDRCPYCRQSGCDALSFAKGGYGAVHYRCLQDAAARERDKADSNLQNGSYLLGVVGAFLGMIVGSIPSFLTIAFMQMEYAVLFALIPLCAYFGYKLFRGKMNKAALVVSILMAILGVFLLYFELIIFSVMHEYGASFSQVMSVMPSLLRDGEVWASILTGALQEFLFMGLGIFFVWRLISSTAAGNADNAAAALQLARPYGQRAQAEAAASRSED